MLVLRSTSTHAHRHTPGMGTQPPHRHLYVVCIRTTCPVPGATHRRIGLSHCGHNGPRAISSRTRRSPRVAHVSAHGRAKHKYHWSLRAARGSRQGFPSPFPSHPDARPQRPKTPCGPLEPTNGEDRGRAEGRRKGLQMVQRCRHAVRSEDDGVCGRAPLNSHCATFNSRPGLPCRPALRAGWRRLPGVAQAGGTSITSQRHTAGDTCVARSRRGAVFYDDALTFRLEAHEPRRGMNVPAAEAYSIYVRTSLGGGD